MLCFNEHLGLINLLLQAKFGTAVSLSGSAHSLSLVLVMGWLAFLTKEGRLALSVLQDLKACEVSNVRSSNRETEQKMRFVVSKRSIATLAKHSTYSDGGES